MARLDRIVEKLGRNKQDVVLGAIEQKGASELAARLRTDRPQFESFSIGVGELRRGDLYEDLLGL